MHVEPASLTRDQAAHYVGLKSSTLAKYAAEDRGPRFAKLSSARSGRVRYSVRELDAWLAAGAPTDRPGARPDNCPRGGYPRPAADAGRNPDGRFARRERNPRT
jgi:predicted DNA-binding transcriptional regulator AlpA